MRPEIFCHRAIAAAAVIALSPTVTLAQAMGDAPAAATGSPQALERVTVTANGRGQTRQVQAISRDELQQLAPGASPLEAVSRLPSVNFQSADPFGAYEWSTRITVRGFNQNQLGFTLDDIPLGDMSYANFNGLHISRAISTENIARTLLSPGTGSLATASSSNLGGTLQFYSVDPAAKAGVEADQSFGSFNTRRTFIKAQTGMGRMGGAYISVADQRSNKWKGAGDQSQQQVNLKYVNEIGSDKLSAFVNTSRRREVDYQDLSLQLINQYGYTLDNTYPDFAAAVRISNTLCGNGGSTYVGACDNQYYAGSGLRDDELYGISYDARFANALNWKTTAYYHHNKGAGLWYTPYVPSPTGVPVSLRTTEYGINRDGIVSTATLPLGNHTLKAGLWYENNKFDQARRFYSIALNAVPSPTEFPSNPFATQWQFQFKTRTLQLSIEDSVAVTDKLTVSGGFKSLSATTDAIRQIGNPANYPSGSITARKNFLPQLGMTYALSDADELFAAYAENMRTYQGTATGLSPFSTTQAGFAAIANTIKPETSQTLEGGWRRNTNTTEAVVSAYFVQFKDRLLAIQQGPGIVGNPSVLANVGKAQMSGVELALSTKLSTHWAWYNGIGLSKSQYKSDYVSNGVLYRVNGKSLVDSPDTMFKSVLSYSQGAVDASLGLDYMSKRYYTYLNDASVDARTLVNGSVRYTLGRVGPLSDASIQLSGTNLTNARYVATVGSNGFTTSDPTGTFQTLLAGAPRTVFLSIAAKF